MGDLDDDDGLDHDIFDDDLDFRLQQQHEPTYVIFRRIL